MTKVQNGQRGTGKVTPEVLAQMVDLLPSVGSLRDLCAITGLRLDTVRRAVAPFLAIMKLQGTHPQCGCGKDRFHPYGCVDSRAKSWPSDCLPGHTREQTEALLARRQTAIEMLVAGERQIDIDHALGMSKGGAKNYLRFLTPEQLATRERRQRELGNVRILKSEEPKRPFSDPLYARIASAVPRWVTDATRDDIISEMYVAIREGTLREDDIEANAQRFASKVAAMWESKFGPRSLDIPLFGEGGTTLGDTIPDPRACRVRPHPDRGIRMNLAQFEGRNFPATHGTEGDGTPDAATSWLADWAAIGGGVSIDRADRINPWRFADVSQEGEEVAFVEDALLYDLENTPGLVRAVRVVIGATAGLMARRALEVMAR